MNFVRNCRDVFSRVVISLPSWASRFGAGDGWRVVNAVLVGLIGVTSVGLVVMLWGPSGTSSDAIATSGGPGLSASTERPSPVSSARRNIFAPLYAPPVVKPTPAPSVPAAPPPPKISLSEKVGHWRLVGVLPGPPVQAIIEDLRAQRTYDVTAGQTVEGVTIGEIREGVVLLLFEEERFELSL